MSRVRYEGTVNGQQVEDTRRYALAIEPDERTYRVDDPGPVANTSEQTEQVRVPNEYGPLRRVGGPLVVALSLLGLVGLVAGRQWGGLAVGRPERERLAFERHREEYDDWITTGRLPADVFDGPTIEVGTLEGLVDVAIDTNERVIEDAESDRFVVLRDDLRYVYEPPAPPADVTDEPPDHSDRATDGEAEPETSTE